MFTIDASVHINALIPVEEGSEISQIFIERIFSQPLSVFSPNLLYVEFAASMARYYNDADRSLSLAEKLLILPGQVWVPLDFLLAEEASRIGAKQRVRGADAVYAAVAQLYKTTLITLDRQQLVRLGNVIPVKTPAQILQELSN
jgi:predicted nucleic acid-binding protein